MSDVITATGGELIRGTGNEVFDNISIDSRTLGKGDLFVAIQGQHHDGHDFIDHVLAQGAGGVMIDQAHASRMGTPQAAGREARVVVKDTVVALGDLARHRRRSVNPRVAAITGTNGKTSTKEMAAMICGRRYRVLATAGNFNNEIGLPLTLLRLGKEHQVAILEMGMNAPGEIGRLAKICEPDMGVVLNVGAGHLEGVENIDGVARAKAELFETLTEKDTAIVNVDDPRVMKMAQKARGRVVTYGMGQQADITATSVRREEGRVCFDLCLSATGERATVALPVSGTFMVSNALAAAAIGAGLGLSAAEIKAGLEGFSPVPGRMTITQTRAGFTLVDDTYNANPESMKAALSGLRELKGAGRGILIMGDMFELGDHAPVMHGKTGVMAAESGVDRLYVTGEFAEAVAGGAASAGMTPEKIMTGSKEAIIEAVCPVLRPGDWVLVKGSRGMGMETVVQALSAYGNGVAGRKGGR
ncbi:MAG: UDP-N-acetylmuramoyl-tripeptide--D-alanyl-D-alanine ligase [Thermodesulfobacteriota bacterium]|nr:UDP-N-acetylmuramoyl-tripeptide--D-alanyl-D-alanine ligase [Thermodesulfobacteriota bacterium]